MPNSTALIMPEVSSRRRRYIPLGFIDTDALCSNKLTWSRMRESTISVCFIRAHNAWMRTVAGRLKSDYNYSSGIVYNNFVWPDTDDHQRSKIVELAQSVLDAPERYPDSTNAQMYGPGLDFMFPELVAAHAALDTAVERAYELEPGPPEPRSLLTYLAYIATLSPPELGSDSAQ